MPELSEEKVAALTEALHRARVEDGSPAPLLPREADRRHVAHILAPLVAGWLAEAGCEFQRTGDGTHGPLIRQAKAEERERIASAIEAEAERHHDEFRAEHAEFREKYWPDTDEAFWHRHDDGCSMCGMASASRIAHEAATESEPR